MNRFIKRFADSHCNFCGTKLGSKGMVYKGYNTQIKYVCSDCYKKCLELYRCDPTINKVNYYQNMGAYNE